MKLKQDLSLDEEKKKEILEKMYSIVDNQEQMDAARGILTSFGSYVFGIKEKMQKKGLEQEFLQACKSFDWIWEKEEEIFALVNDIITNKDTTLLKYLSKNPELPEDMQEKILNCAVNGFSGIEIMSNIALNTKSEKIMRSILNKMQTPSSTVIEKLASNKNITKDILKQLIKNKNAHKGLLKNPKIMEFI